jgi:P-type Ca2+ transporter type 2C
MISNWHNLESKRVIEFLCSDKEEGISLLEAKRRQRESGRNLLPKQKPVPKFKIFLEQFHSPLIYILLIAGIVVIFFGDLADGIVILAAVAVNTVIGFAQENKANQALFELKKIISHKAKVVREGEIKIIDSSDIVAGDVFLLEPGDMVPADGRVLESDNLKMNEMALTGEWLSTTKHSEELELRTPMADRDNMVYMGTIVEDGRARVVSTAIGQDTELGKIASIIKETKEERTPYQKKLSRFSKLVGIFIGLISLLIFIEGILTGGQLMEMFIISIAVAIAAIPEGLPVAMTIILALGMQRILRKKGLIRKLSAAETLGSTSVICTDKTATLTEGKIKVTKMFTDRKNPNLIYKTAVLCNGAFVENGKEKREKWIIRGAPTDRALLSYGLENGCLPEELKKEYQKIDDLPFDSSRKYRAKLYKKKGERNKTLLVAGAPELIIATSKLDDQEMKDWNKQLKRIASKGYRTIALAYKKTNRKSIKETKINNLHFLALLGMSDPIREDVKDALKTCRQAGMKAIIVTGDHKLTAKAVGLKLGFKINDKNIMEGSEIDELNDEEFKKVFQRINIYARVEPKHKLKIVKAWQDAGEVVAMTGDGINDSPALKKADIGVALGSGTEVAKETSDLILLNNSFSIIVAAVEEGRAILDNIRKVITYLLSDSFTEIILIGGSILIAKALAKPWVLPLTAIQILWVNLAEDGLPSQALAFEPKENGLMKQKATAHKVHLLTREMKVIIFAIGLITDLMLLGLLYWFMYQGLEISYIRTMIFAALAIDSLFYVFSCRSLRKGIFHINPLKNKFLLFSWIFGVFALLVALYVPFFNSLLKTVPLNFIDWMILIFLGVTEIIFIEIVKHYFIIRHQTEV